jgi:hypothetical protein
MAGNGSTLQSSNRYERHDHRYAIDDPLPKASIETLPSLPDDRDSGDSRIDDLVARVLTDILMDIYFSWMIQVSILGLSEIIINS